MGIDTQDSLYVNCPSMCTNRVTCECWLILSLASRDKKEVEKKKRWVVGAAGLNEFIFCMMSAGHGGEFWEKDQQLLTDSDATTDSCTMN